MYRLGESGRVKICELSARLCEFDIQLFFKKESLQATLQKMAKLTTPANPTPGVGTTLKWNTS